MVELKIIIILLYVKLLDPFFLCISLTVDQITNGYDKRKFSSEDYACKCRPVLIRCTIYIDNVVLHLNR